MQVKLSDATPIILAFDGEVLECFFDEGGSKRIHITHLKSFHMEAQSGRHLLTLQLKRDQLFLWIDEPALPKVTEFLAELQKAMSSHTR